MRNKFSPFFGRPAKTEKQKQVQTHGEGPRRGWTGDIGLNFVVVFGVWSLLRRPAKTKKTKTKVQTHGEGHRRGWTGDIGLNFLLFLGGHFWEDGPKQKNQNNKFRPMERDPEEAGQRT